MKDIRVVPDEGATEVMWDNDSGYIVIPHDGPVYFPHGDGFRMIFDGDDTRVEGDDGSILWHSRTTRSK